MDLLLHVSELDLFKSTTVILTSWLSAEVFVLVLWSHWRRHNTTDQSPVHTGHTDAPTAGVRSEAAPPSRQQAAPQQAQPCWFLAAAEKSALLVPVPVPVPVKLWCCWPAAPAVKHTD